MPKRHRARLFSATAKSTVAKTQKLVTKITFGEVIFSLYFSEHTMPMIALRSDNNCLVFIESILFPYVLIYYSFISKQIDLDIKETLEIYFGGR